MILTARHREEVNVVTSVKNSLLKRFPWLAHRRLIPLAELDVAVKDDLHAKVRDLNSVTKSRWRVGYVTQTRPDSVLRVLILGPHEDYCRMYFRAKRGRWE